MATTPIDEDDEPIPAHVHHESGLLYLIGSNHRVPVREEDLPLDEPEDAPVPRHVSHESAYERQPRRVITVQRPQIPRVNVAPEPAPDKLSALKKETASGKLSTPMPLSINQIGKEEVFTINYSCAGTVEVLSKLRGPMPVVGYPDLITLIDYCLSKYKPARTILNLNGYVQLNVHVLYHVLSMGYISISAHENRVEQLKWLFRKVLGPRWRGAITREHYKKVGDRLLETVPYAGYIFDQMDEVIKAYDTGGVEKGALYHTFALGMWNPNIFVEPTWVHKRLQLSVEPDTPIYLYK